MRTHPAFRAGLVVVALSACSGRAPATVGLDCTFRTGDSIALHGALFLDQHGDFVRSANCPGQSIRVYGIRTAEGEEANALRVDIDSTLTLFNVHWVIDATVRSERDQDGPILRILYIRSLKRVDERPNSSFKSKPLRGSN